MAFHIKSSHQVSICAQILKHEFTNHCALKLEKSAISKVQKNIICIFKNDKKNQFLHQKKSQKIAFCVVLNFFLVQKLIFLPFLKLQKMWFCTFEIALFSNFRAL